jgi:soluble lytic murein transglycosylase-like protein
MLAGFVTLVIGAATPAPSIAQTAVAPAAVAQAAPSAGLDLALLMPRPPVREGALDLPAVLTPNDVRLYREIFQAQQDGEWAAVDRKIRALRDKSLVGHVLAQRYLHKTYRSSYKELAAWLEHYADMPEAIRIHRIALQRQPKGAKPPVKPIGGYLSGNGLETSGVGDETGAPQHRAHVDRAIQAFTGGDDQKALAIAAEIARGGDVPGANWTAGLAAWRLGNFEQARQHFEALARSKSASGWSVAGGAYWAARAHLKLRRPQDYTVWLARAAEQPRTFYGLLARRQLGIEAPLNWDLPELTRADIKALMAHPGGKRAMALIQIGDSYLAERELRRLYLQVENELGPAILALAAHANMPALAMRLGGKLVRGQGLRYDAALYPTPSWQPEGGFSIDPALLFAIIRQESAFNQRAQSQRGASGLMQIMPRTAAAIADDDEFDGTRERLLDPGLNLALGQRLIRMLLDSDQIQGHLIMMAAAYNAGQGNLSKWERRGATKADPLLYIESLPSRETRAFIERVLTNYWIYRQRMGLPTPSLDAIAQGGWPIYADTDGFVLTVSENAQD